MIRTLPKLKPLKQFALKVVFLLFLISTGKNIHAQCPPNIDFEAGNFLGWECWVGTVSAPLNANTITWNPAIPVDPRLYPTRFQMLSSVPGDGADPYGLFPRNCPNGSGHSIQLGNDQTAAQAEGVSYTFTIPAGQSEYNLIYNYAVVFQDPGHFDYEQPRLVIEIKNLTDGTIISCSSFDFISTASLPGFFVSPTNPSVLCKNWSATTINLDGLAGKTIQLFFKTADCTRGGHFGYAYVDVNTECSSAFIGAAYCADDTAINVTAPFGYQTYTWWDAGFTTILGTMPTIIFNPPPPPGTRIAVVVDPYAGYGCKDTLYADLVDTLNIRANAGPDLVSCNRTPVQIGVAPKPNHVYSWSPVTGLSDPTISNPIVVVSTTTQFIVTTSSAGGGCVSKDTVIVNAAVLDSSIQLIGIDTYCLGDPQAAVLKVNAADSIQWYRNGIAIPGATQTTYAVTQSGTYHATVFSFIGCSSNTPTKTITVNDSPVAGFTMNSPLVQCQRLNNFVITNNSTIASGTMQYLWDYGDGSTGTTVDGFHFYSQPGTYTISLIVTSDKGCKDTISQVVTVNPSPVADVAVDKTSSCFAANNFVFTNNSTVGGGSAMQYFWDFGDGNSSVAKDVSHSYTAPGAYLVRMLLNTDKGCTDSLHIPININPDPKAGFTVNSAQQCFDPNDFVLTNTSTIAWGNLNYTWTFGDGASGTGTNVNHHYLQPGTYRIKMVAASDSSCADSSFMDVNILPYPFADFFVRTPACVNQDVLVVNKTLNNTSSTLTYVWDYDDGHKEFVRSPSYGYPAPGQYNLRLSVSTIQCPTTINTKIIPIVIEAPAQGIVLPEKEAIFNFPEKLQARYIGNNIIWSPGQNLDNRYSYTPTYRGITSQLYTIQMKTPSGCVTVDTLFVRAKKKIEIYVPSVFTPGNDGLNDYLKPLLYGFDHVNYFRVYNRWGKLLFQMNSDRPGWDGRVNGQITTETQTVVWMIEAVDVDGVLHRKQGTTVLMR